MSGRWETPYRHSEADRTGPIRAAHGEAMRPAAAYRVSAATGSHQPVARWVTFVVLALILVVLKPWSDRGQPLVAESSPPLPAATRSLPERQPPPATVQGDGRSGVADICLDVGTWLVASVERYRNQTIRIWRAMDPAPIATGPLDPQIPQMSMRSEGVLELGWCAPDQGAKAQIQMASVDMWRTGGGTATRVDPVDSDVHAEGSGYGAIYLPLGPARATWDVGTYVFRLRSADGRERWFGLRVESRPALLG